MEKSNRKGDEGASSFSNDIDIISIGTLYRGGRWEKKYWSSSRGKDRHPYPIGYRAVRTYNGIGLAMEIQQESTGPLFVITSSDGQTSSGQTPDIVWKNFQRACSPRVKSLRGKRMFAEIDGMELFGFKYDMVQLLLRQMVAVESQGTKASSTEHNTQIPNQRTTSAASHELPNYTESKAGEKRKTSKMDLIGKNKPKKVRPCTEAEGDNTMEGEKYCASIEVEMQMLNGVASDPPSTLPKEKAFHSHDSDDGLTAEESPARLSQDEDISMSHPNISTQNDDCDSIGEEITMSMMKLLLPQAVPLLKKARRTKRNACGLRQFSSRRNATHGDLAKDCPTADANSVDGKRNISISEDIRKAKRAFESSQYIVRASSDTEFNRQTNHEQLPDVPDSCDEADDKACVLNSCDELDKNGYVPDSCDELDDKAYAPDSYELDEKTYVPNSCDEIGKNAIAPDSCDELDDNAYVLGSCDEHDENAYVPDSCDELDDKETIQDSRKEFNENHYVLDFSNEHDKNYFVPDSCDEFDDNKDIPDSTGLPADMDARNVMQDCHARACEGEEVPCTSYSKKILEDSHNDDLQQTGRFILASQQQNTNPSNHKVNANVSSDELNSGTCSVFVSGCQSPSDKCVFNTYFEAAPNQACVTNQNLYEKADPCSEPRCSGKIDRQDREETKIASDTGGTDVVLQKKTPICNSNEDVEGIQELAGSDQANNRELVMSSNKLRVLHHKQSLLLDDSIVSACQRAFDGNYSKLSIATEHETKLSDFRGLIGLPGAVAYGQLSRSEKNVSSKSQSLYHKQSAFRDENSTSVGQRASEGQHSKLSMVAELDKNLAGFGKHNEFPASFMVSDEELLMCERLVSSRIETLHRKQLSSLHDRNMSSEQIVSNDYNSMWNTATELDNKLSGFGKLIGLYEQPKPVLSVLICSKENETYICTSCGTLQDNQRTLYLYKLKTEGSSAGRPYSVGYSHMLLPETKCFLGRQIALDKSGLQFTPNGQNLVLLNGMQVPSCRNGLLQCRCLECESHSSEENAVKIVQLMDGYVEVLVKLETVSRVLCLLVCEPNYLVAVEENGAFRFWSMNATWRHVIEEFILPPTECISPCAVELKQIPNCPHLIVGHNCLGEFGLWDISRHSLIKRFVIPDVTIFRCIPVSLHCWNRKDKTFTCLNSKKQSNIFKNATKLWSSQCNTSTMLNLSNKRNIVISVLVATCPDIKSSQLPMPDGCWKLGILMNNKVIINHTLDARTVTVAASGDYGVHGTSQGYLHVWDLTTGLTRDSSLCFKDGRVQCLYTDTTRSGLLAVSDDKGKLLLYYGGQEI